MDIVSPVIDLLRCIMVPTCDHVKHHRILGQRMEELRIKVVELKCRKEDIHRRVLTEIQSDQEVLKLVGNWLEVAEAMIMEYQKVEEKFHNVSFMYRSSLSKLVLKELSRVHCLLSDGIALDPNAEGDRNRRLKFRERLEEKIMGYLMGDDVGIIGVCGQGGVGKTALAKRISNKISYLMNSKFDKVIWAPLPYPFSITKLQDTIAELMGRNLPKRRSEEERAAKLFEIMGNLKFVLILDDAWERFSFEDVGIPAPTRDNGCKVVITSRSTKLCKDMGCNDDGLVEVNTLSEEESLNLLLDVVGGDIRKNPDIEGVARELVKECAGLPLAIVVMAMSMWGEYDISAWRNELNELRTRVRSVRGWDNKIFERLKLSYHRLNNEELQNCFLFCSLYGKSPGIEKEELIEYWIDGGLIKNMKRRKTMADRARDILNRLISDCLIEEVKHGCVRMNGVIRDMALRVADSRFMVRTSEEVVYITVDYKWTEYLEKVSMFRSGIMEISPEFCPNCPKLSTLVLSENSGLRRIPESFFKGMPSLEYLDLSSTRISVLPSSISNLIHLTTLRLRNIRELKDVPSLAKLKALTKLDLMGAGIKVVPEGIEVLVNLQHLDLRCPNLLQFPIYILKDLSHLEFLSATNLVIEGKQVPRLNMLETVIGEFHNLEGLGNYVKFFHQLQKLPGYMLMVGKVGSAQTVESSKKVTIGRLDFQGEQHSVLLPNDFQQLKFEYCSGVESLSEISLLNTETDLRSCVMEGCTFRCILDSSSSSTICSLFDKCESIRLFNMGELHALIKGAPQAASAPSTSNATLSTPPSIFSNIKIFEISSCPRIKKLFPSNLLKGLQNLEEIHVSDCEQIEEMIQVEEEEEKETVLSVVFSLAKLRKLVLMNLPKLKRLCTVKGVMVCDSIQVIEVLRCPKLKRIPLYLRFFSPPPSLQEIRLDSRGRWEVLEWDSPTTKEILRPFLKPYSDVSSLTSEFDGLQDFNNFTKYFQDESLTSYKLTVEAIDDDGDGDGDGDSHGNGVDFCDDSDYYGNIVEIDRDSSKMLALCGVQINGDQTVLLPNGLQCLEIRNCPGLKSLCEFKTAGSPTSCLIKQCRDLECMLELLPSSSVCNLLDGPSSLMLSKLPNLQVLARTVNQATPTASTSRVLTLPSIFSNLRHFVIFQCPTIKKLFPSELLVGLQNLEKIWIIDCAGMEEIIEGEEDEETLTDEAGDQNKAITFALPKLKHLGLVKLPKLKRICTARGVVVCDSIETIYIAKCEALKRIPLDLLQLSNGQLSPPLLLKKIYTDSTEFWELLPGDKSTTENILYPFLQFIKVAE